MIYIRKREPNLFRFPFYIHNMNDKRRRSEFGYPPFGSTLRIRLWTSRRSLTQISLLRDVSTETTRTIIFTYT